MGSVFFLCLIIIYITTCTGKDLILGDNRDQSLVWQEKVDYSSFPFKKRVKEVFYSDPSLPTIKGIIARDLDNGGARATVTAGGLGLTYATVRLKSERGGRLNYQIGIYV